MRKNHLAATCAMLSCVFLCCEGRSVQLGAGYKYVHLDGRNSTIADNNNHMIVDPNVKRYRIIGPLVVGVRVDADIDSSLSQNYGYFVLDTRNGQLVEGLNSADFERVLRRNGVHANPF